MSQAGDADALAALETTGRFGLSVEGVPEPRVRVLAQVGDVGDEELEERGLRITTRAGDVVAGEIALSNCDRLDELEGVVLIEAARPMLPELDASLPETRANLVHTGPPGRRGAGVIVGIIDSGIDWRHQVFRDGAGNSRVLRLWDQNLTPQAGETSPGPFNYGVEYQQGQINTALAAANPLGVVRSIDEDGGHGTHVAGIAAGDGSAAGNGQPAFTFIGVAPDSDIVLVANRVTTPALGDSATTLDAVQYIFNVAQALGRPAVINLSQGDNLGPHDGTSVLERGIDNLLGGAGRSMVKSAGNAANAGVHASGTVAAGGTDSPQFVVPANDFTTDTLDFWYDAADRIGFRITPPGGTASATVNPGTNTTLALPNGNRVFVDSVLNHPNNGDNRIFVQLQPGTAAAVQQGTWTVTLVGTTVVNGGWHGWVERGNTVPQFIGAHRNDQVTISVPGTSSEVITAASYITKGAGVGNLSTFSSRGPTRDGRAAPTIAAPGQQVLSANSGAGTSATQYLGMSGTSMAAPHVAGTVALLLQASPTLTQQQIIDLLTSNARSDAFTGGVPNNDWGAGKLDAHRALLSLLGGRIMIADFSGGQVPAHVRYWEHWEQHQLFDGWQDDNDWMAVGDFMHLGYDQLLSINRTDAGDGRLMIADFSGGQVPAQVRYWENWGQHPLFNGWHDDNDWIAVGDFMHLGYDQLLSINRTDAGDGRVMVADFSGGQVPAQVRYWENWGQHPLFNGWHDDNDWIAVGDFMHLGYDQLLSINRTDAGDGRIMIADFSGGQPPAPVRYWEIWGEHPLFNGWHDDNDWIAAGDFMHLGYDQLLSLNRTNAGDGRVMVADFSGGRVPAQVRYWENWGQHPLFNGWHDDNDWIAVGDFMHLGYDQLLSINRTDAGDGRLMIADFSGGQPAAQVRYWENWGQHPLFNGWQDDNDRIAVGNFMHLGHDSLLSVNRRE